MTPPNETPSLPYLENAFRSLQKQMHQLDQEEAREKLDRDAARQRGLCSSRLLFFGESQGEFNQLEQQILAT